MANPEPVVPPVRSHPDCRSGSRRPRGHAHQVRRRHRSRGRGACSACRHHLPCRYRRLPSRPGRRPGPDLRRSDRHLLGRRPGPDHHLLDRRPGLDRSAEDWICRPGRYRLGPGLHRPDHRWSVRHRTDRRLDHSALAHPCHPGRHPADHRRPGPDRTRVASSLPRPSYRADPPGHCPGRVRPGRRRGPAAMTRPGYRRAGRRVHRPGPVRPCPGLLVPTRSQVAPSRPVRDRFDPGHHLVPTRSQVSSNRPGNHLLDLHLVPNRNQAAPARPVRDRPGPGRPGPDRSVPERLPRSRHPGPPPRPCARLAPRRRPHARLHRPERHVERRYRVRRTRRSSTARRLRVACPTQAGVRRVRRMMQAERHVSATSHPRCRGSCRRAARWRAWRSAAMSGNRRTPCHWRKAQRRSNSC